MLLRPPMQTTTTVWRQQVGPDNNACLYVIPCYLNQKTSENVRKRHGLLKQRLERAKPVLVHCRGKAAVDANDIPSSPTADWSSVNLYRKAGTNTWPIASRLHFAKWRDLEVLCIKQQMKYPFAVLTNMLSRNTHRMSDYVQIWNGLAHSVEVEVPDNPYSC